MPIYIFECCNKKCGVVYEKLTSHDESGKYSGIKCPECGSKRKKQQMHNFSFSFGNPVGTDKWNGSHDYRFKHTLPKAKEERSNAEKFAKQKTGFNSKTPYRRIDDISSGKHFGEVK